MGLIGASQAPRPLFAMAIRINPMDFESPNLTLTRNPDPAEDPESRSQVHTQVLERSFSEAQRAALEQWCAL